MHCSTRTMLAALAVASGLSAGELSELTMSPIGPIRRSQVVTISVPDSSFNGRFTWFARGGRFLGPLGGPSVSFEAVEVGQAEVVSVVDTDGIQLVRNISVAVAAAQGAASARGAGDQRASADIGQLGFIPSNWMGDGERQNGFKVQPTSDEKPHSPPFCQRWEYRPVSSSGGGVGWGAVGWAFPANNWGDRPGKTGLAGKGYSELSFWVRGLPDKSGHFPVIQFKTGGNTDPSKQYQATYEAETDFITLTAEWGRHAIPIAGKDLKSVISAFTFVLRAEDNPNGAVFFLDDIEFR